MSLPQRAVNDAPKRVLIVDDSPSARAMLVALLGAVGLSCTEAGDGGEGFDLHLQHRFDLVVTDLEMPRMDGFQLIAALGLLPGARRPPVIVVSAAVDEAKRLRPYGLAPALAAFAKPIDAPSFLQTVARALQLDEGSRGGANDPG